jgi:lipoprotein-releasing system permease protein
MSPKLLKDITVSLLKARWRQTLVAAIGVTFSITMFITLLGFMNGLNKMLDGLILNRTPHIRMFNEIKSSEFQPLEIAQKKSYHFIASIKPKNADPSIHNITPIIKALKEDKRVEGISPKIFSQVFYNLGTIDLTGNVNGIDVAEELRLFKFADYVVNGNASDLKNVPNSIILGIGAAKKMQAKVGDVIQVTTVSGERFTLKIVGFFQSGIADLDKVQSFASIKTVQKLLGKPESYITDIQVKLKDLNQAPPMAKEYAKRFDIDAEDIQTANAQFETGSSIRSLISYAVGITLLIVSGFGIYNILNMMIYEKMDTIAILKATGFAGKDVQLIFMAIALTIGVFGGISGLIFGFSLSTVVSNIPFNTAALPTVKTFPVDFSSKYYFIAITFAIITTYLAGYLPSRKASKVDPVVIIRGK